MSEPENNPPKIKVSTFDDEQPQYERVTDEDSPETPAASEAVDKKSSNPFFLDENHADIRQVEPLGDAAKTVEIQIKIVDAGTHQLANAMVGKPYKTAIDLNALKINEEISLESFAKKLSRIGLQIENDSQTKTLQISGTPLSATQGEQEIHLDYGDDAAFIHRKTFILLINPDPKSLWKNIEPDADAPYQKSNTANEQLSSKDFRIFAASRRGRSHAHDGKFREDDFALKILENAWHLIIVADGAGSAKFSREGSRIATATGIEFLTDAINNLVEPKFTDLIESLDAKDENADKEIRNLLYQTLCGAAHRAYKNIEREANESQSVIKDFATTLLMTIVKKFNEKTFVASFGIGDGAICVYDEPKNKSDLMNTPDGGEFSGQTRFLTMRELVSDGDEMLRRVKYNVYDDFTALYMMTDGVSDPKFATDKNLLDAEKWHDFNKELEKNIDFTEREKTASQALLEWTDFWSQGEHDDRTIAILI